MDVNNYRNLLLEKLVDARINYELAEKNLRQEKAKYEAIQKDIDNFDLFTIELNRSE